MLNKDFLRIEISFIQNELAKFTQFGSYSIQESIDNVLAAEAIKKFLGRITEQAVRVNQYLIIELSKKNNPPLDYLQTFQELVKYKVYSQEFVDRIARSIETNNALAAGFVEVGNINIYSHVYECVDDYYKYCTNILNFIDRYQLDFSK
jgi:uncharacterized protein YutE (UPF0331/DUF86 family)